ncbi:hypothetical protein RC083_01105 [Pseudoalteromonas haloplanktis]|uniref:Cell surface protein n=1 Tax=Pseudoalteromonas haloplanktis TaxID=228 RepID=A0ABU1B7F8_PSEHA|nr:hypothetical protein [Pseudoalteromonas haloplanktis]MDQ9090182.1 hypothetical protein [Pseudoalteromonas haloplanktis]
MMTYLSRLSLFILLTCSFNSFAKYSEAMCILYKQQMQQYSDNTSSRSYRNAARDFEKNCSNPPPVEKTQAPVTQPKNSLSEPVTEQAEDSKSIKSEQANVAVNPLDSNTEQSAVQVEQSEAETPSKVVGTSTPVIEQREVTTTVAELSDEPVTEQDAAPVSVLPPVTPINTDLTNNDAQTGALLIPSLLLLAVLLLAGLLLLRLRAKKNPAPESIKGNQESMAAVSSTTEKKPSKPIAPIVNDESKSITTPQSITPQPVADIANEPEPQKAVEDSVNQEQLTQRLLSSVHDFKEPEVRTFDPDAPLPGQKARQESNKQTSDKVITNDTELTVDTATLAPISEPDNETNTDINMFAADNSEQEIVTAEQEEITQLENDEDVAHLLNNKQEAKLTEDSFDQIPDNTDLDNDDNVAKALAALNEELAAEQQGDNHTSIDEQHASSSSERKANPFANLSLDPSWDPNSTEKPTIAPKKTVPKSAKLIAAEERAKQLKTDDE